MRRVAAALAALILAAALAVTVSGRRLGWPCSDHGGVQWTNGKVYQCDDGTWE